MSDLDAFFDSFGSSSRPATPQTSNAGKRQADSRPETRVRVNWPARVLLPNGAVQLLRVHDLTENGAGFAASSALPSHQTLTFAIAVPDINGSRAITVVTGTIRVANMTIRGLDAHCGGPWIEIKADARALLNRWIRRLRK